MKQFANSQCKTELEKEQMEYIFKMWDMLSKVQNEVIMFGLYGNENNAASYSTKILDMMGKFDE
jgi:hypothetical protein